MKTDKLLLIILILIQEVCISQICFINLKSFNGVTEYDENINQNACELIEILPEPLKDSFLVLGFNNYLLSSSTNSIISIYDSVVGIALDTSKYYLLILRSTSSDCSFKNVRINLKLPNYGIFNCLNVVKTQIIINSYQQLFEDSSNYTESTFVSIFLEIIKDLKNRIYLLNNSDCDQDFDDKFSNYFENGNFSKYKCSKSINSDFPIVSFGPSVLTAKRSVLNIYSYTEKTIYFQGQEIDLALNFETVANELESNDISYKIYITESDNINNSSMELNEIIEEYENPTADIVVWTNIDIVGSDTFVYFGTNNIEQLTISMKNHYLGSDIEYAELNKNVLKEYIQNKYCILCSDGQLENETGNRFESSWHNFAYSSLPQIQQYRENSDLFEGDRNTMPDGICHSIQFIFGRVPDYRIWIDASWFEVKAKLPNKYIYTSTSSNQIKGHLDNLRQYQPEAVVKKQADLYFITTDDVIVSLSLFNYATKYPKINLRQYISYYKMIDNIMNVKYYWWDFFISPFSGPIELITGTPYQL